MRNNRGGITVKKSRTRVWKIIIHFLQKFQSSRRDQFGYQGFGEEAKTARGRREMRF